VRGAVPELIALLADPNVRVRSAAVNVLAGLGPVASEAVPALAGRLSREPAGLQSSIVDALAAIGPDARPAIPALDALRQTDNPWTRQSIAVARAKIDPSHAAAAAAAIREFAQRDDADERSRLASILGDFRYVSAESLAALTTLVNDKDRMVAWTAAATLGRMGEPAVPALTRALRAQDKDVRVHAAQSLGSLGPGAPGAVTALILALGDRDEAVRVWVRQSLATVGPPAVLKLIAALHHPDPNIVAGSIQVLGEINPAPREAVPELLPLLADRLKMNQFLAAQALGEFGVAARPAVPKLKAMLKEPALTFIAVEALAKIDPAAAPEIIPILVANLSEKGLSNRMRAAWALRRVGPAAKDQMPALRAALAREKDQRVLTQLKRAMKTIDPSSGMGE
jgi:HEAT repeat protein